MKNLTTLFAALVLVCAVGCAKPTEPAATPAPAHEEHTDAAAPAEGAPAADAPAAAPTETPAAAPEAGSAEAK